MHGKKMALAVIGLLFSLSPFCQNGGSIQGTVIDKSSRLPLEFATIQLLNIVDFRLTSNFNFATESPFNFIHLKLMT
jgi:hypothetical protein